jgi:predicted nuclease of predicted toxin-antitoxin system
VKLWIDVQLPPSLCAWLHAGFGVESSRVQDAGLREADDADVFDALRREGEVVLTKDEDFIDLVTRLGPPPQILWLRVGNCSNDDLRAFLQIVLPQALDALRRGDPVVELRRTRSA